MYSEELYSAYLKRKSFHLFLAPKGLKGEDEASLREMLSNLDPLYPEIRTEAVLVEKSEVSSRCGATHYVLFYSEKKDGCLENVGYMGEQVDLWCAANGIGTVWLGMGKTEEKTRNGLDYVIMIGLSRVNEEKFRSSREKVNRKDMDEIWKGEKLAISEDARFAPSACNSQPWLIENKDNILSVHRLWSNKKQGLMSPSVAAYFNRIDMGILLFVMELSMMHHGIESTRISYPDGNPESTDTLVAQYGIK